MATNGIYLNWALISPSNKYLTYSYRDAYTGKITRDRVKIVATNAKDAILNAKKFLDYSESREYGSWKIRCQHYPTGPKAYGIITYTFNYSKKEEAKL